MRSVRYSGGGGLALIWLISLILNRIQKIAGWSFSLLLFLRGWATYPNHFPRLAFYKAKIYFNLYLMFPYPSKRRANRVDIISSRCVRTFSIVSLSARIQLILHLATLSKPVVHAQASFQLVATQSGFLAKWISRNQVSFSAIPPSGLFFTGAARRRISFGFRDPAHPYCPILKIN